MEKDKVKKLLDAFYDGNTTPVQEQELYGYFLQNDIPEEFETDRKVFLKLFSADDENDIEVPLELNNRIDKLIDSLDVKEKGKRKIHFRKWVAAVAAGIAILLSAGIYTINELDNQKQHLLVDTYKNPEDAYDQVQKTLTLVSSKMNKGIDQFEKAEEDILKVNKTLNKKLN